uniref:Uncharacterized protein n=1 Tax=Arundo donax TaxID=35708 RepID=A0A0A8ZW31_ARUDO
MSSRASSPLRSSPWAPTSSRSRPPSASDSCSRSWRSPARVAAPGRSFGSM